MMWVGTGERLVERSREEEMVGGRTAFVAARGRRLCGCSPLLLCSVLFCLALAVVAAVMLSSVCRGRSRGRLFGSPPGADEERTTTKNMSVADFTKGLGEEERVAWLQMPKYTATGSLQLSLPDELRDDLQVWYRAQPKEPEETNAHLVGDIHICSLAGTELETRLRDFLQEELERWTGQTGLIWTNSYGPREYRAGATLAAHSDRIRSHAVSAIVYVDSEELEEPWALQFVPRDASPQDAVLEVFVRPGAEVLLYESTLPHGRITPLKGRAFAATFFHWAPKGWRERAEELVGPE